MEDYGESFVDSEEDLDMDFNPSSIGGFSDTTSSYTLDSGIGSCTQAGSDTNWSPFEIDQHADYFLGSPDPTYCFEAQIILVKQAAQCLFSSDIDCTISASAYLFHICKIGYSTLLIQACPDILCHMVAIVRSTPAHSVEVLHFLSGILHYLSHTDHGVDFILSSDGVELLSLFLTSTVESVLYYTVTALHSLLLVRSCARDIMRDSCMIGRLIHLLNLPVRQIMDTKPVANESLIAHINPKFMAILCDCLHILAYGHETTKKRFLEYGAIRSLVKLISFSHYEKLLWTGARLLRVLSAWMPVKLEVLANDSSLKFLTHCLSFGSLRVTASALWTLRNLSDLVIDKLSVEDITFVVGLLVAQMRNALDYLEASKSQPITELKDRLTLCRCILDIIGNLTCGNSDVKSHLVKLNGVKLISRISQFATNGFKPRHPNRSSQVCMQYKDDAATLCQSLSNLVLRADSHPSLDPSDPESPAYSDDSLLPVCQDRCHVPPSPSSVHGNPCEFVKIPFKSLPCTKPLYVFTHTTPRSSLESFSSVSTSCSIPSANVELLEASFRCLSHLTAGHNEAINAVTCFVHQRSTTQLLTEAVSRVFLPLVSYHIALAMNVQRCERQPVDCDNYMSQTLQLLRAWATLVNNVMTIYRPKESKQCRKTTTTGQIVHKHFPKPVISHLRRSLRCLVEKINRLTELVSDRTQCLVTVQQLLHHLQEKITLGTTCKRISSVPLST